MPYATLAEVQQLMAQFTISATSTPNTTQATAIMTDISNEIDVRLSGAGFSVPVTDPQYFEDWLALLNSYGAAAAVLKSMFPDAVGIGETPAYAFWEARYQQGLKDIADGTISPADTPSNANTVLPATYLTRNPDTEEEIGVIAEPLFKIGQVF
jgi:hypothetical protein